VARAIDAGPGHGAGPGDVDVEFVFGSAAAVDRDFVRDDLRVAVGRGLEADLDRDFVGSAGGVEVGDGQRGVAAAGAGDRLFGAVAEVPDHFARVAGRRGRTRGERRPGGIEVDGVAGVDGDVAFGSVGGEFGGRPEAAGAAGPECQDLDAVAGD